MPKKNKKKSNPFFTFIKVLFIILAAFILAGYVAVKMYLAELGPIPQLENYNRNSIINGQPSITTGIGQSMMAIGISL